MSEKRSIPFGDEIASYIHCKRCIEEFTAEQPVGESPQTYARLSVGMTTVGLQVWCYRHECNVLHIDFEGHQHPASSATEDEVM